MAVLDGDQPADVAIETTVDANGASIISVSGELDISNVDSLGETIEAVIAERPEQLVFDLGGLQFVDSAGIAVLVGAAAKVGVVRLRNPTPVVRRVVEITGLTEVLPIEP
jgi:anti-anti-sigma factor